MKRLILAMLIVLMVPVWGVCDYYMDKDNAWALRCGRRLMPSNTELETFYGADAGDLDSPFYELAYERFLSQAMGIEMAVGFLDETATYHNGLLAGDMYEYDIQQWWASPTIKAYWRANDIVSIYVGAGGDIYSTRAKMKYESVLGDYSGSTNETSLGWHACGGVEFCIYREPGADGYFAWPVSLVIEYKYTDLSVDEVDKELITAINAFAGTAYPAHDLDAGGSYISAGLKWHF